VTARDAVIEVEALRFRYPRQAEDTLHGLGFEVGRGEVFGFLGPSGAGKSTTQKILTGLLPGFSGRTHVFGEPIAAHGRGYYERIGVSFEVPNVYGRLTGRENLAFFASLYSGATADPADLLERVGLTDAADRRAAEYSKGMRMRLNFARALLRKPELLFLDEPTSGQDPENARRLKRLIRAECDGGATVFLTTHDMAVASELCDRVAFIVDGRIAIIDTPRALEVRHGQRRVRVDYAPAGGRVMRAEFELDGLGSDPAFFEVLRGARVEAMHTLDATLEDVFLAVTGRSLA
jgi:fluoroquinolone transport system ATP-binding protein